MKTKSCVRKSKYHGLKAEWLVENVIVLLKFPLNREIKMTLIKDVKALLATMQVEFVKIAFTQRQLKLTVAETSSAVLDLKAIRAELRKLVTAVVATKSNPAPQIQAALFTTTI